MKLHNRKFVRVRDFLSMVDEIEYKNFDITFVNPDGTYHYIANSIDDDDPEAYFKRMFNYFDTYRIFGKCFVLSFKSYEYGDEQIIHLFIAERKPK